MPIDPKKAKQLAKEINTIGLNNLQNMSDEMLRLIMEAGDMEMAEKVAQIGAEAAAALIVRKNDVRDLAKRVRERVEEDEEKTEQATPQAEAAAEPTEKKSE
jgi:capsid portal protein